MDNNSNALAELAGRLIHHLEIANAVAGFDQQVCGDIRKSQRIISELAKVKWITLYGLTNPRTFPAPDEARDAVANCHAIAKEGVDDDR